MSSPRLSKENPSIFSGVNFFLSRGLPTSTSGQTRELLIEHGALEAESMKEATHVISSSDCFIGANEAKGAIIVTPTWVERSVILGKQQDHRYYSADPRMIFSGIIATSSDLPKQDSESIASGIMAFGGQWKEALTNDVTHMFCLSASGPKYAKALENQNNPISVQVVLPHWFEHSFKAETLLSVKNYLFPNPPILAPDFNEKNILYGNPREAQDGPDAVKSRALLRAAAKTEEPGSNSNTQPTSSNRSAFSNYVLGEKRVVFSSGAVQDDPNRDSVYRRRVEQVGGTYISGLELGEGGVSTKVLENADIFVTLYRDNEEYELAAKAKVIIGTPAWILYITSTGLWSAPQEHLLHYPYYEKPVPGFENQVITITNYTGDAREYLKKARLIAAVGGKFTPSMTSKNTCVIASHVSIPPDQTKQNKITKARQWRLPIVSHLWLEDSFREWTKMPLSDRKYTEFPPGHDWMQDINARGIGTAPMPAPPRQEPPQMTDNTNVALNPKSTPTEKPVSTVRPPSTIKSTSTVKSTPARRKSETTKQSKAPTSMDDASSKTPSKADGAKRKNKADTSQSAKRSKTNGKDSNVSPAKSAVDFPSVASSSSFVKSLSAAPHGIPVKLLSPEKDRRKPRKSLSDDEDSDNQDDDSSSSTSEPPAAPKGVQPSTSMGMGGRKPRAAATAAQDILRNVIMPDVQKFQNEMSSSRGDVRKMEQLAEKKQRRASMAGHDNDGAPPTKKKKSQPEDENDKPGSKKAQAAKSSQSKTKAGDGEQKPRTSTSQPAIRIICSKTKATDADKRVLERLGANFTDNPLDCTHLVVNSISRTEKFLCAFPRCTYVITMRWIEESAKAGRLLEESEYKLSDPENERVYSMDLAKSMKSIRKNGGELFKGHTFFLTDHVGVDFKSLQKVIESSGGVAKLEPKPTKKKLGNDMRHHHVISSNEAKPSWQALEKEGIPIYSKEFVLNSVLRQELDWNADRIL